MNWPNNELQPIEQYVYEGDLVRIGRFDCHKDDSYFPVTESVADNMYVLATRALWLRRGTKEFQYVGPGSVLFHPAGCTIERRQAHGDRDLAYWFAVEPATFEEALTRYGYGDEVPCDVLPSDPSTHLRIASILNYVCDEQFDRLETESRVLSLLDHICHSMRGLRNATCELVVRQQAKHKARRLVDNAKAYINENLTDNNGLSDVAREIGVSSYYLCRLFKSVCGLTVHEYKTRQRLVHVFEALKSGAGEDLAGLALDTGFSSHSHLTRMFARRYGIAPSQFRKLVQSRQSAAQLNCDHWVSQSRGLTNRAAAAF
ncbi:MAG: AraC family transcriptional regulator [Woeseiaceae bacterium]|nr:AraC family transcriptional regulator [Woeseiaceae bacterium]